MVKSMVVLVLLTLLTRVAHPLILYGATELTLFLSFIFIPVDSSIPPLTWISYSSSVNVNVRVSASLFLRLEYFFQLCVNHCTAATVPQWKCTV